MFFMYAKVANIALKSNLEGEKPRFVMQKESLKNDRLCKKLAESSFFAWRNTENVLSLSLQFLMKIKIMKKQLLALSLCSSLTLLTGCLGESEYHYTAIYYPDPQSTLFADQTEDSINFVTFDSWTLVSQAEWLRVPDNMNSGSIPGGYYVQTSVPLTLEPNTTGKARTAIVNIMANGNMLSAAYQQLSYLCITHPERKDGAFELVDSSFVTVDSLVFHAYGPWTLSFAEAAPTWASWEEGTATSGTVGDQKVRIVMQENLSEEPRSTVLRLTSKGVSNDITLVQLPPKKDEESL